MSMSFSLYLRKWQLDFEVTTHRWKCMYGRKKLNPFCLLILIISHRIQMAQYMIDIIFSISADTYNFQSIQYSADTDKLPAIEIFPYQLIDTDNRYDRICDL